MAHKDDEIYPNSPLVDVACEIRFPGEMSVECNRDKFWELIRADYPDILVPPVQVGQHPALQHYRFRSADKNRAVGVALNSLSYSETKYRGHQEFIKEYLRIVGEFRRAYPKIKRLTRIGWRYVNIISFARESGRIPLERFLKFKLPLPQKVGTDSRVINLRSEMIVDGGLILFRLENLTRNDQPDLEGIAVDIDYVKQGDGLSIGEVDSQIKHSRQFARDIFEEMITDEYRDYLRGNTL